MTRHQIQNEAFSIKKCGGGTFTHQKYRGHKGESGKLHATSDPRLETSLDGKML